jgi:hypothetical protein
MSPPGPLQLETRFPKWEGGEFTTTLPSPMWIDKGFLFLIWFNLILFSGGLWYTSLFFTGQANAAFANDSTLNSHPG